MKLFTDQEVEIAAKTDLVDYLSETEGFTFSGSRRTARCKQIKTLIIKPEGFFHWNNRVIRGNAIQFVELYRNMTFKEAMIHLLEYNNIDHSTDEGVIFTTQRKGTGNITISKDRLNNAYAYLIQKRGINKDIIDELIDKGLLVMSREDSLPPNMAFKIEGPDGREAGYEVHGTYDKKKYKGCIPDKKGKQYGFNIKIGNGEKAYIFESAIDLISFYQMWSKRNPATLKNMILISLSGTKEGIIREMQRDFNIKELILCVDNDDAGDKFKQKLLKEKFKFKAMTVPEGHKDWNEYLIEGRAVYN